MNWDIPIGQAAGRATTVSSAVCSTREFLLSLQGADQRHSVRGAYVQTTLHNPISPVLLRRVNRVRARMDARDPADAILDDVIVLWRALESTFLSSGQITEDAKASAAVSDAIEYTGIKKLPQSRKLAEALSAFVPCSRDVLAAWFPNPIHGREPNYRALREQIQRLEEAAHTSASWRPIHSQTLGSLLYRIRCAVIHARVETTDRILTRALPTLRNAMIELMIARAAETASIPFTAADRIFAKELDEERPR